ncbi:hypothetical protein FIBSPDRAFT_859214, partial [Athelia psychrophila]
MDTLRCCSNVAAPPLTGTKGFVYFERQRGHPAGALPIQASASESDTSAKSHRVITGHYTL